METDHTFYELFSHRPEWLAALTGVDLPKIKEAHALSFKAAEARCDLVLEPVDSREVHTLVEFQFYFDWSIFNRTELSRQLLWRKLNLQDDCRRRRYRPRAVQSLVIFGSPKQIPPTDSCGAAVFVFDDLLDALRDREPNSPLLPVFSPLFDSAAHLEKNAKIHYRQIVDRRDLSDADRRLLTEIYLRLIAQRFKDKSPELLRKMIAELTPLAETSLGKSLLAEGRAEGRAQGQLEARADLIRSMKSRGLSDAQIAEFTGLQAEEIRAALAEVRSDTGGKSAPRRK
ncbi:MAG: DUF2887 domain-containing protein [Verrucomicrobiales bacterium]